MLAPLGNNTSANPGLLMIFTKKTGRVGGRGEEGGGDEGEGRRERG